IHHHHARLQQLLALDQLFELVRRPRTQAFALRAFDELVAEVLLEPAVTGLAAGHGFESRKGCTVNGECQSRNWRAAMIGQLAKGGGLQNRVEAAAATPAMPCRIP